MKNITSIIFLTACLFSQNDLNRTQNLLSENLKPFQVFINKTFKGEFATSTPEKPVFDISRWERALNGNAIRIMHSVNNGEYGGETIIMWNPDKESLMSWYFTTGGILTNALVNVKGTKITSIEDVTGNNNGITKVKSLIELKQNGG